MFKKGVIRIVVILLPLLLVLVWLFVDKPGFYGDEITHLAYLDQALNNTNNANGVLSKLITLYVFNQAYPPFFYVLSLPFLNFFSDVVIGMRVYVGGLFLSSFFVFYKLLRIYLSREAALSGCLFLCTSGLFIFSGRFYFIEILLLLETLAFYYLILMNCKTNKPIFLFLAGFVLSLGLLTKFNFVIYAGPVALFYYGILFYRLKKGDGSLGKILINMAQMVSFSVLISLPWYAYNIYSQGGFGALSAVGFFYQIGLVQKNDTIQSFVKGVMAYFKAGLPAISLAFLFTFVIALAISRLPLFRKNVNSRLPHLGSEYVFQENAAYFWMPLIFVVIVTIYVTYMGMPPRWNLSYAFLAMAFALLSERLPSKARSLFLISSNVALFVVIFNSYVWFLSPIVSTPFMFPNPLPAGPKEVVDLIIKDSEKRYVNKFDGFVFGVIASGGYHDVRAVDYYATKNNFNAGWMIPSYWENPAGAEIFFMSDYLIYTPENLDSEHVNVRYKYILEHLPVSYKACLSRVAVLKSKSGEIIVDNLNKNCLNPQVMFDLIEVGRKYDENTPLEIFWNIDFENAKLKGEEGFGSFREFRHDYLNLLNKLELGKRDMLPNYYVVAKNKLEAFYKNAHIMLKWDENVLLNPGFEEEKNGVMTGWIIGDSRHVSLNKTGTKSHMGSSSVRISSQDAALTQQVAIDPQQVYLLKQFTRSSKPGQKAALQVLWIDENSNLIKADIVYYNSTSDWSEHEMIVFPPSNSKYAIVYATVVEESSVWFDEITFQGAAIVDK